MSELQRLKRVFGSWVGKIRHRKKRRHAIYEDDDAILILADLGLHMSPEAFEFVSGSSSRREDFLQQLYMSEDELGIDLILDNIMIDPRWKPRVVEEGMRIAFLATVRGEELIIAEYTRS